MVITGKALLSSIHITAKALLSRIPIPPNTNTNRSNRYPYDFIPPDLAHSQSVKISHHYSIFKCHHIALGATPSTVIHTHHGSWLHLWIFLHPEVMASIPVRYQWTNILLAKEWNISKLCRHCIRKKDICKRLHKGEAHSALMREYNAGLWTKIPTFTST